MSMERLRSMKERAMLLAETGLNQDISCIDAKELGEVIDIVKDMEEAIYYCSIIEAMEKTDNEEEYLKKYLPEMSYARNYYPYYNMKNNAYSGKMYYSPRYGSRNMKYLSSDIDKSRNYSSYYDDMMHDDRDGNAWIYRRNYIEDKELKKSEQESLQDLEEYAQTLVDDVMELIQETTPKEREILKQKISTLSSKL